MDLRSLANRSATMVNPNELVTVLISTGYTTGAGQKQVPTYAPPVIGPAQIQALDDKDLKLLEGLNIQGYTKAIFLRGILAGVIRPDSKGGDLIQTQDGKSWLVVKILEGWPTWTKAAMVLQGGTS
jgi:hypothetical protein